VYIAKIWGHLALAIINRKALYKQGIQLRPTQLQTPIGRSRRGRSKNWLWGGVFFMR